MFLRKGIIIVVLTLLFDQINKWHMINVVKVSVEPLKINPFFNLVMVWNNGISFGMFQNSEYGHIIFSIIALIIVVALFLWMKRTKSIIEATSIGLVIGGATGNVIDRFNYGAVADFYDFHINDFHWPAFNIADMAVFIGAVMLCICTIFCRQQEEQKSGE